MDPAGWVHRFSSSAPPKGARQFERSRSCTRDGCCALLYQGRLNLTRAVCHGLSHSAASDSTQYFRAALCWCVAVHCCNLGFLTCLSTSVQELQPQSSQVRVPVTVGSHAGCKILGVPPPRLTHETPESLKAIYRGCHIFISFQKAKYLPFFLCICYVDCNGLHP